MLFALRACQYEIVIPKINESILYNTDTYTNKQETNQTPNLPKCFRAIIAVNTQVKINIVKELLGIKIAAVKGDNCAVMA